MEKTYSEQLYHLVCDLHDYLSWGTRQERQELSSLPRQQDPGSAIMELNKEVAGCSRCRLHEHRNHPVPGAGNLHPLVLIVGEGPGKDEDLSGVPFVGKAGQYLDTWLDAIGLVREQHCFIANVVKCRPPGNRDPQPDEKAACMPYLERQIDILKPASILCLGRIAAQALLHTEEGINKLRTRVHRYDSIPLVATYHPSAVLRNPELKRPVWENLKTLKGFIASFL
ncbi:MAG: uracil-DNA glycosylase [Spirochaetales bacterium]|nr:uracil-DNA glycosylase [Spirochaetales bacterium]